MHPFWWRALLGRTCRVRGTEKWGAITHPGSERSNMERHGCWQKSSYGEIWAPSLGLVHVWGCDRGARGRRAPEAMEGCWPLLVVKAGAQERLWARKDKLWLVFEKAGSAVCREPSCEFI